MKRIIAILISAVAAASAAFAATTLPVREVYHEFSEFNSLNANGSLNVRVVQSDKFSILIKADDNLQNYIESYVREKTLYVVYKEGDVPRDVKKIYKGKGAPVPTLDVTVSVPSLSSVNIVGGYLVIDEIQSSDTFTINAGKDATARIKLASDNINITTADNANIKLNHTCTNLNLTTDGKSVIVADGQCSSANASLNGSSRVNMTGSSPSLTLSTARSSVFEALNLENASTSVIAKGGTATVSPQSELTLDMDGGTVFFFGEPTISIVKMHRASLAPYGVKL